jgi:hypothetical protein
VSSSPYFTLVLQERDEDWTQQNKAELSPHHLWFRTKKLPFFKSWSSESVLGLSGQNLP